MSQNYEVLLEGRLFVGSADEAQTAVQSGDVKHVFDVRVNGRKEDVSYSYTHSPIEEDDKASTIKSGAEKVAEAVRTGETVYIHCGSGTGRAAVMAAATLMELRQASTIEDAIEMVKEKRTGARFQPEMVAALNELYK